VQKATTIIEHIIYDKPDERWGAEEVLVSPRSLTNMSTMSQPQKKLFEEIRYNLIIEKDLSISNRFKL
jgi:hypothetical protein